MKDEEITAMMDEGPVADYLFDALQFPKGCKWGILQQHQIHKLLSIVAEEAVKEYRRNECRQTPLCRCPNCAPKTGE